MLDTVTPGGYPSSGACGVTRTPGCYENRLRIAVLTFATRSAHGVSLPTAMLANMYTFKHGYDYIVEARQQAASASLALRRSCSSAALRAL